LPDLRESKAPSDERFEQVGKAADPVMSGSWGFLGGIDNKSPRSLGHQTVASALAAGRLAGT